MNLTELFPPSKYRILSVDIETDGVIPTQNSITSVGIADFDMENLTLKDSLEFRFLRGMDGRVSDPATVAWRKNHGLYDHEDQLEAYTWNRGLNAIIEFVHPNYNDGKIPVMFANHVEFDIGFLNGYFAASCFEPPWRYKNVYDLGSICLAKGVGKSELYERVLNSKRWAETREALFSGKDIAHTALYDATLQAHVLAAAFGHNAFSDLDSEEETHS